MAKVDEFIAGRYHRAQIGRVRPCIVEPAIFAVQREAWFTQIPIDLVPQNMRTGNADFDLFPDSGAPQSEHRLGSDVRLKALEDPGIETSGLDIGHLGWHTNCVDMPDFGYRASERPFIQDWIVLQWLGRLGITLAVWIFIGVGEGLTWLRKEKSQDGKNR